MSLEKIKVLKPKCLTCGRVSVESQDRICPIDKTYMKLELVEIEVK